MCDLTTDETKKPILITYCKAIIQTNESKRDTRMKSTCFEPEMQFNCILNRYIISNF